MRAEIIGVGNETQHRSLFEGCREYLRGELRQLGLSLGSFRLVPPRGAEVYAQLLEAVRAGDVVLILAAAEPDAAEAVTQAVCDGLRLKSNIDQALVRQLTRRYAQRGMTKAEAERYALAPAGCRRILNPAGPVQGYAVTAKKQLMLVLPAVPGELMGCFSSGVRQLFAGVGGSATAQRTLRAVELGESPIRSLLGSLLYSENPRVALQSQNGEAELHITASGGSQEAAQDACDAMARQVADRLGALLTSTRGEPLADQVCRLLAKHRLTVSSAEAGTGGLLAAALKSGGSGGAKVLAGGMNLTSDAQKAERLGISKHLLTEAGGVSRRVAAAMAVAVRKAGRASLGIAVTCGDEPGDAKMGYIYAALTDGREVWAKKLTLPAGAPLDTIRSAASLQALNMLRLYAQQHPEPLPGGVPVNHAVPGSQTPWERAAMSLSALIPKGRPQGAEKEPAGPRQSQRHEKEADDMNLLQRILKGKLTRQDGLKLGILGLSLAIFVGCIIYIASVYAESHKNKGLIQDQQAAYSNSDIQPEDVDGYPSGYLPKFAALYAQNDDIAGWIKIEGTKYLDMPVVQTSDNEYYERRDFTRADNQHGVAFVDWRVAQREPSTNTVIYAHNMNDGQMFGELLGYKSIEYYRQHPLVQYDSVYYEGMYKIFGVVVCKKDDPDFLYHSFIEKESDAAMTEFVNKIRERSILNTKVDVRTDDKLLTLSTCDYTFKSETGDRIARFVVFARKVREGESTDVDVAGATINTNPVMPAEWYSYLQRQQEAELKRQQEEAAKKANSKWLTKEEMETLSPEEQKALADRREKLAQQYLTYDERESENLETMLALIDRRRDEFELFLTGEEEGYSLSKRIKLSEERRRMAEEAGLSESEIRSAGSWEEIQKLIEQKKGADAARKALQDYINQNKQLLSDLGIDPSKYNDLDSLKKAVDDAIAKQSAEQQKKLLQDYIDQNRDLLQELGIDPNRYNNLNDLKAAVEKAIEERDAKNKKELQEFINANKKWLGDTSGKTLDQLKQEKEQHEKEYNDALSKLTDPTARKKLEDAKDNAKDWNSIKNAIDTIKDPVAPPSSSNPPPPETTQPNPPSETTPPNPPSETTPPNPPSETTPPNPPSETTPPNPPSETTPPDPPSETTPPNPPSETTPPDPPSETTPPDPPSESVSPEPPPEESVSSEPPPEPDPEPDTEPPANEDQGGGEEASPSSVEDPGNSADEPSSDEGESPS